MQYSAIIGHKNVAEMLQRALSANAVSHAYLFAGQESIGKMPIAQTFAHSLLCLSPTENGEACGTCNACVKLSAGTHPDLTILSPEGAGEIISIKTLREIVHNTIIFAPIIGKRKIYLVNRADRLGLDAANSLLKVLEEPPEYAHFILCADTTDAMLSTILSRCQIVRMGSVSDEEIIDALVHRFKLDEDQARLCADFAEGAPGKAISLSTDEARLNSLNAMETFFEKMVNANKTQALRLAEEFRIIAESCKPSEKTDNEKLSRLAYATAFDLLAKRFRASFAFSINSTNLQNDDVAAKFAEKMGQNEMKKAMDAILRTKRAILGNANVVLATESMFTEILV